MSPARAPLRGPRGWAGRAARSAWVAALVAVGGCRDDDANAIASLPGSGSTSGATAGTAGTAATTGGGVDPRCMVTPDDSGGTTGSATRLDAGGGEIGGGFSVTCADVVGIATNLGCEFWAVDLPNDPQGTPSSGPAAAQQFAVVVANASSLTEATVAVYVGAGTEPVASAVIPVDALEVFELASLDIDSRAPRVDGIAYRIVSDTPVTAVQFNPLDNVEPVYSNDASLLIPTHALGRDYIAATGDAIQLQGGASGTMILDAGAFIAVVATEDDTAVEIVPTARLQAGSVTAVTLARGQVVHVLSTVATNGSTNLSSTRVRADRPVAVFGGNVATVEPASRLGVDRDLCCADHVEHQILPVTAWGSGYAVVAPPSADPPVGSSDRHVVRISGGYPATELVYCPTRPAGAPERVEAGQTVTFETGESFTVQAADPAKPIAVTQFLLSASAASPNVQGLGRLGDPAMLVLPAAAQYDQKVLFPVPAGYVKNFATIVRRGPGLVLLDGEPVPDAAFFELGVVAGELLEWAYVELAAGPHVIDATAPVGVIVTGYDEAVSYGFPAGVGVRVIAPVPPVG